MGGKDIALYTKKKQDIAPYTKRNKDPDLKEFVHQLNKEDKIEKKKIASK